MSGGEPLGLETFKSQRDLRTRLHAMSDKQLVAYATGRDHCNILEKELAERLSSCLGAAELPGPPSAS